MLLFGLQIVLFSGLASITSAQRVQEDLIGCPAVHIPANPATGIYGARLFKQTRQKLKVSAKVILNNYPIQIGQYRQFIPSCNRECLFRSKSKNETNNCHAFSLEITQKESLGTFAICNIYSKHLTESDFDPNSSLLKEETICAYNVNRYQTVFPPGCTVRKRQEYLEADDWKECYVSDWLMSFVTDNKLPSTNATGQFSYDLVKLISGLFWKDQACLLGPGARCSAPETPPLNATYEQYSGWLVAVGLQGLTRLYQSTLFELVDQASFIKQSLIAALMRDIYPNGLELGPIGVERKSWNAMVGVVSDILGLIPGLSALKVLKPLATLFPTAYIGDPGIDPDPGLSLLQYENGLTAALGAYTSNLKNDGSDRYFSFQKQPDRSTGLSGVLESGVLLVGTNQRQPASILAETSALMYQALINDMLNTQMAYLTVRSVGGRCQDDGVNSFCEGSRFWELKKPVGWCYYKIEPYSSRIGPKLYTWTGVTLPWTKKVLIDRYSGSAWANVKLRDIVLGSDRCRRYHNVTGFPEGAKVRPTINPYDPTPECIFNLPILDNDQTDSYFICRKRLSEEVRTRQPNYCRESVKYDHMRRETSAWQIPTLPNVEKEAIAAFLQAGGYANPYKPTVCCNDGNHNDFCTANTKG